MKNATKNQDEVDGISSDSENEEELDIESEFGFSSENDSHNDDHGDNDDDDIFKHEGQSLYPLSQKRLIYSKPTPKKGDFMLYFVSK